MANLFRDIVMTTSDPKKLRMFFASFIQQIVVKDGSVRIEYQAELLVNRVGFDTVHSNKCWLPDLGSNQGHTD